MLWQVLVTNMDTIHRGCGNYCEFLGRECVGAWEEDDDTCQILSTEDCDFWFGKETSDAICQCGGDLAIWAGSCD